MAKRYSIYKRAQKLGGGDGEPGSPLNEYNRARTGKKEVKYTRTADSFPEEYVQTYLTPFTWDLGAGKLIQVSFSGRANTARGTAVNTPALLLHKAKPADAENIVLNDNFIPAKVTSRVGAVTKGYETSKVTGVRYRAAKGQRSYTLPFGSDGTKLFYEQAIALKADIEGPASAPTGKSANISSEIIRGF